MSKDLKPGSLQQASARSLPLVLGVDGGGTKTLAWLAQVDDQGQPQVVGQGSSGSSNLVALGLDAAMSNLAGAIDQAYAAANLADAPIASVVFALSGSGTAEAQKRILNYVEVEFRFEHARVVHDGQAVLEAGTPDGWGIAFIAGTGAVAYGIDRSGHSAVTGGWGYWFGDEGSAYWLGQSALRAVSQAADGRAEKTLLTDAVLERLQIKEPRELLATLASLGDIRLQIAGIANLVFEAAQQQDEVANRIAASSAQHWSRHVQCLAQQLFSDNPFPLAVAGGVLCGSPVAREMLLQQLDADRCRFTTVNFVEEPVSGCLKLACKLLSSRG